MNDNNTLKITRQPEWSDEDWNDLVDAIEELVGILSDDYARGEAE